jgi:hypothetical protein
MVWKYCCLNISLLLTNIYPSWPDLICSIIRPSITGTKFGFFFYSCQQITNLVSSKNSWDPATDFAHEIFKISIATRATIWSFLESMPNFNDLGILGPCLLLSLQFSIKFFFYGYKLQTVKPAHAITSIK